MNRFTKINEIKELKDTINKQKQLVAEEVTRLHTLENEYTKVSLIELPILLFTLKNIENERIYVYFYADLNKVDFISKENEVLHNATDLTSLFKKLDMPSIVDVNNAMEYTTKIDLAVNLLTSKIDELFNQYDIKSWQELGVYLQALKEEDFNLTAKKL